MGKTVGMSNNRRTSEHIAASTLTESEAVRMAQDGDAIAFERLYQLYSGRVYRLCLRMTNDRIEAEDLTQEAFLQLFRKIHTFDGRSRLYTWLHRITVNIVLMKFRRRKQTEISLDGLAENNSEDNKWHMEPAGIDAELSGLLDRVNLQRAVNQLSEGYRQVFILHDVEGYEHSEIAKLLGFSTGNSKSQLFKARVRLRGLLCEILRDAAREKRRALEAHDAVNATFIETQGI